MCIITLWCGALRVVALNYHRPYCHYRPMRQPSRDCPEDKGGGTIASTYNYKGLDCYPPARLHTGVVCFTAGDPGLSLESLHLCNVVGGRYVYMEDLLKLEANSPAVPPHLPARALEIITPLRVEAWHSHLLQFPDKRFPGFILRGLQEGFRIGFESVRPYRSSNRNMKSAHEHPTPVQTYLDRETSLRRIFPLTQEEARAEQRIQISPFGVIPKRGKPDKWRLIIDLLSPAGLSVNDGVTQELCSISYTSVDE